jgi:hypothetical protein
VNDVCMFYVLKEEEWLENIILRKYIKTHFGSDNLTV